MDSTACLEGNPTKAKRLSPRSKTAFLVASTKKYSYIWYPFFKLFKTHSEEVDGSPLFDFYMISEDTESRDLEKINREFDVGIFSLERDIGFINSYEYAATRLKGMGYQNMILMQDDFLVQSPIDNDRLLEFEKILLEREDVGFVRICPCPGPTGPDHHFNREKPWRGVGFGRSAENCALLIFISSCHVEH